MLRSFLRAGKNRCSTAKTLMSFENVENSSTSLKCAAMLTVSTLLARASQELLDLMTCSEANRFSTNQVGHFLHRSLPMTSKTVAPVVAISAGFSAVRKSFQKIEGKTP